MQGQASDIRIHAEEINRLSKRLNEIYAKHTGQPTDVIGEHCAYTLFSDGLEKGSCL